MSDSTAAPKPTTQPKTKAAISDSTLAELRTRTTRTKKTTKTEKTEKQAKLTPAPPVTLQSWRGQVKRTIAQTAEGAIAPIESFTSLGALMNSLLEDGEVRVRYGLYAGATSRTWQERIDLERRNVRTPCWLYAVRVDSSGPYERDIQLLIGTSSDTAHARFMIAEFPEPIPNTQDALLFEQARAQLMTLLPKQTPTADFQRIATQQVTIEGSLFFDGIRTATTPDDPSGVPLAPWTVWEINPVTAITALPPERHGMQLTPRENNPLAQEIHTP